MAKFKVGDRIKVCGKDFFHGGKGTIVMKSIIEPGAFSVSLDISGWQFLFYEDELEYVYEVEGFEV